MIAPPALIAVFIISFVLSVIAYMLFRPPYEGRIFYYPDNAGTRIGAERRGIPLRKDIEEQLTVFLEELFLGPISLELTWTVARGTKINNIAVIGKNAYIDLSSQVLDTEEELPISYDESFENIGHNIKFNFPGIEEIVFTIEGQQVNKSLYVM